MPATRAWEPAWWSRDPADVIAALDVTAGGLSSDEAARRLSVHGPNHPRPPHRHATLKLLLRQLRSPIALLLLITATLSAFLGDRTDALIIIGILIGSSGLGFWQEYGAARAMDELLRLIRTQAMVRRDGVEQEIPIEAIVPGDIVVLGAGDLVPADCRILETKDLDVDESALTGESFPVAKDTSSVPPDAPLGKRRGAVFMGTNVVSGTAVVLVVATGSDTVFGALAEHIERRVPESAFEHGVRRFGYLLLEITVVFVVIIFAFNVFLGRPLLDVLLFALALAVGLTPQLLPAIVSVTLARGARRMAKHGVIVRRLVAIEDFGGMTVLCTDKTGTLTEGEVRVKAALDAEGRPSAEVGRLAFLNAALQSGFENPIDAAIRRDLAADTSAARKLDEVPWDFTRRRLSVLVECADGAKLLITKGAVPEVLAISKTVAGTNGTDALIETVAPRIESLFHELGGQGLRTVAIALRRMDVDTVHRDDERDMVFAGILTLSDPPKAGIAGTLAQLRTLGLTVKMLTGDNRRVAAAIAGDVGMSVDRIVTGAELEGMTSAALARRAADIDVFAELDPNQKDCIIRALKSSGVSVGYLGDGINDAASLHAADVGISVDTAVDVTRQAADIVLLRKDLDVLGLGIAEGRRAFANTLKYVFINTSATFGNMFSMAGASLIVPFLPMLPKQILLLNLLSDLPAMAIATDRIDPELAARPRRWDVRYIRDFMLTFGLISSAFDFLTFGLLLWLAVPVTEFRAAWFIESVLSQIFVLLVIRTRRRFYRSPPSRPLTAACIGVSALALTLPFMPWAGALGFTSVPPRLLFGLLAITFMLLLATELAKRFFFARHPLSGTARP